jgi:AcrR family transcriptional regulator
MNRRDDAAARAPVARTPARERYHHGDLPAALKQAAVTLIAREGVEGFSLREAASAVGVSPSAAYRHYADRAALLAAIADDAFGELADRFDDAMQRIPGDDADAARARFLAQGKAYVRFALEQPERFAVMFGRHGAGRAARAEQVRTDRRNPFALLSKALDDLQRTGAMPSARREGAELIAWSAIHGLASLLVVGAINLGRGTVDAMVARVGEDCLRAMATPSPAPVRRTSGR